MRGGHGGSRNNPRCVADIAVVLPTLRRLNRSLILGHNCGTGGTPMAGTSKRRAGSKDGLQYSKIGIFAADFAAFAATSAADVASAAADGDDDIEAGNKRGMFKTLLNKK